LFVLVWGANALAYFAGTFSKAAAGSASNEVTYGGSLLRLVIMNFIVIISPLISFWGVFVVRACAAETIGIPDPHFTIKTKKETRGKKGGKERDRRQ
jgi:hypothetical protein